MREITEPCYRDETMRRAWLAIDRCRRTKQQGLWCESPLEFIWRRFATHCRGGSNAQCDARRTVEGRCR